MDYSSSEELFGMRLCLLFKSVQQRVVEKVGFILKVKDRGKMIRTRSGLTERTMSYFAVWTNTIYTIDSISNAYSSYLMSFHQFTLFSI